MKFNGSPFRLNHGGYVLAVTMWMLLLLTVIGVAAIQTSTVELKMSGNVKAMVGDFYATEGALITALERTDWWLSDDFLKIDAAKAHWTDRVDFDGDTIDDAMIEIRCVEKSKSVISKLSDAANNFPADQHSATPPVDSGYSARYFYARRYAATATSLNSNTKLQSGAWKIFNRQ